MSNKWLSLRVLAWFIWFGLTVSAAARADDFRTWTDSTGRFQIRAKLASVEGASVMLIREDGQAMTIAKAKLSKVDQEYLAGLDAENPFQAADASPFTPMPARPAAARPLRPAATRPADAGETRTVTVDWSQSEEVPLAAADTEWKITPPAAPALDFRPKSVALPQKTDFFEKMSGIAVNLVAKKAAVGYSLAKHGAGATTRVLICDLERGRVVATGSGPGELAPIALHDNGRHVVMRQNEFHKKEQLEVWAVEGSEAVRSLICTPYAGVKGGEIGVLWAEFVDAATLATASRSGRVALWNIATMQPICHFEMHGTCVPAISDDRQWIAFATSDRVGLFHIEKREVAVLAETPTKLQWPHVAFSPSGGKIGCAAFNRILVWDTATGALEKNFIPEGIHVNGAIDFPDDGFILSTNQFLIALDSQLKLWHYDGAAEVRTVGGTTFLGVPGFGSPGALVAAKLPHAEAAALLESALKQPDIFAFHKGSPVKLNVSGIPEPHRARVSEALTKKLEKLNCPVQATAAVEIAAGVEGPTDREVRYMHSGDYKVKEYRTWLKFLYQGKPIWETSGTNIQHFIMLQKGENIESVLRKASEQPAYGFYDHVTLPEFLQKPGNGQGAGGSRQTLGSSKLTAAGVR